MPEDNENQDPMEAFEEVESVYTPSSARRGAKGGTAEETGWFKLNRNGSDEARELVRELKLDPDTVKAILKANALTRTVAVQFVGPNTPNAQTIRINKDRTYTLYLHPVFEEHPSLRPGGRIRVKVTRGMVKGQKCLLIDLNGLATRTTKRETEE